MLYSAEMLDQEATLHRVRGTHTSKRIASRWLISISLVAGLGIAGCNVDSNFAGLGKSLLDPDAQGIESPGRLIVAGEHTGLRLVDDPETGERFVLSRTGDGSLSIF